MPELPEVETLRRSLEPELVGRRISRIEVRERRLRKPVELPPSLEGARIKAVGRRGKFLLLETDRGTLLVHLGMSGRLLLLEAPEPPGRHDHLDLHLSPGRLLRYRDPRRFGLWLWSEEGEHPLLQRLGPEPFEIEPEALYESCRSRHRPIKSLLLDGGMIAGVGNIYASEALFLAGIHPFRPASSLDLSEWQRLLAALREVLRAAIARGGTTLRDFRDGRGQPGSFQLALSVYGRERCPRCGGKVERRRLSGRSTYLCPACQR